MLTKKKLSELRKAHAIYIAKVKAAKKRVLAFTAPCCGGQIETPAAPPGARWDSLASCPHCGSLFMHITTHSRSLGLIPGGLG
jgi:hypothetical protein